MVIMRAIMHYSLTISLVLIKAMICSLYNEVSATYVRCSMVGLDYKGSAGVNPIPGIRLQ